VGLDYTINLRSTVQGREYDAIIDRIARDRPGRVLDWGCGHGQNAQRLAERGLDVTAFDFRPGEQEESGPRRLEKYPEIEAYIEVVDPVRLPYPDDSFDAVLSMGVLEHVGDPGGSLDEHRRILRPGGRLYVYKLPNRFSYTERLGKLAGHYWHGLLPDDRLYTLASAVELVRAHGFEVDEARRANILPLNRPGDRFPSIAAPWWAMNRALARVPGVNVLATNIELVATARPVPAAAAATPR
jgi:SAM-dependent methyltransferase